MSQYSELNELRRQLADMHRMQEMHATNAQQQVKQQQVNVAQQSEKTLVEKQTLIQPFSFD